SEYLVGAPRNRACPTFFHSAATCLDLPARLTRESTKREGRKPRTSERHVVGCCEQLGGAIKHPDSSRPDRCKNRKRCAERRKYGVWQHYVGPEEHMAPSACSPIDCLIAAER